MKGAAIEEDVCVSYDILDSKGKSLRFVIDDYVLLKPDLKNDWQFVGRCPKTKRSGGLIVHEYHETLTLPYLKKTFTGLRGVNEFIEKYFKGIPPRGLSFNRRKRVSRVTETQARKVNARLRKISKQVLNTGRSLMAKNRRTILNFTDFEFEFKIQFYLSEKHRLYHPSSDNQLCNTVFSDPMVLTRLNFNDTNEFTSFPHCYLFHDLIEHKGVSIDDLVQVDFIWIDYELTFQKNLRGLMK